MSSNRMNLNVLNATEKSKRKRSAAGVPMRLAAGVPTRSAAGRGKDMCHDVLSTVSSSLTTKMFAPNTIKVRIPDNNRLNAVNIDFESFTQITVGVDVPIDPLFLLIPGRGQGFFVSAGISAGKLYPCKYIKAARDLSSYTYVRNIAARFALASGTISSTNATLAGTFNACSFFDIRDFNTFSPSEFSTVCMTRKDYAQGVASWDGIVMVSSPDMIPNLTAKASTEVQIGGNDLIYKKTADISSNGRTVFYDYTAAPTTVGPIFGDRQLKIHMKIKNNTSSGAVVTKPTMVYTILTLAWQTMKVDGTLETYATTTKYCKGVSAIEDSWEKELFYIFEHEHFSPDTGDKAYLVAQVSVEGGFYKAGVASTASCSLHFTVYDNFRACTQGPGFLATATGLNDKAVVTLNLSRSLEGVPSGPLLPDVKSDTSGYELVTPDEICAYDYVLSLPDSHLKRIYTRSEFSGVVRAMTGNDEVTVRTGDNNSALLSVEDRAMAGPISSLITSLAPIASMIPGIGPTVGQIGGIAGNILGQLGFAGPPMKTRRSFNGPCCSTPINVNTSQGSCESLVADYNSMSESEDEDDSSRLAKLMELLRRPETTDCCPPGERRRLFMGFPALGRDRNTWAPLEREAAGYADVTRSVLSGIQVGTKFKPGAQTTPDDAFGTIATNLAAVKTSSRYEMAAAGEAYLGESVTSANLVAISEDGVASLETLFISDFPIMSYDRDMSLKETTYLSISIPTGEDQFNAFFSDDFHIGDNLSNQDTATSLLSIVAALAFAGISNRYVTLPRPGTIEGPSLGLPALIAALGIVDPHTVYTGGLDIDEDDDLILTPIFGSVAKAELCRSNGMKLISTWDDSNDLMGNFYNDTMPFAPLNDILGGVPLATANCIVVSTLGGAILAGMTMSLLPSLRTKTVAETLAKKNEAEANRQAEINKYSEIINSGGLPVSDSFRSAFSLGTGPVTTATLESIDVPNKLKSVLVAANASEATMNNMQNMLNALSGAIASSQWTKVANLTKSVGDYMLKNNKSSANSGTSGIFTLAKGLQNANQKRATSKAPNQVRGAVLKPGRRSRFGNRNGPEQMVTEGGQAASSTQQPGTLTNLFGKLTGRK